MRLARNIANIILTKKAIRPKQLNSIGRWDYKCVQLTFTAGVQGRRKFGNGPAEPTKLFHVFIGPNKTVKSFDCERIKYGGMVRWLKKSSKDVNKLTITHDSICTWSIFRTEIKAKMNGSNFKPSRFQMRMLSCVIDVLRWLSEPSHHTPV